MNRVGGTRLKVLIFLAVLFGVIYYGKAILPIFYRSWAIEDRMQTEVRLAQGQSIAYIDIRIREEIENLELPEEALRRLVIQQLENPRRIQVQTRYSESVDLPFFERTWTFTPTAVARH